MDTGREEIPILDEFDELTKNIDKTGKDVMILALLYYARTTDTKPAEQIMPGYLFNPYMKYIDVLNKYWEKRSS